MPNTDPRPSVTDDELYERLWDAGMSNEELGAGREQRSQDFPKDNQPGRAAGIARRRHGAIDDRIPQRRYVPMAVRRRSLLAAWGTSGCGRSPLANQVCP
jgi:hypothetical protein